jgi:hypothetical protein
MLRTEVHSKLTLSFPVEILSAASWSQPYIHLLSRAITVFTSWSRLSM